MSYPSEQTTPYFPPQQGDLFHLRLIEHMGALIFWHQRTFVFTGTLEQCEAAYRRTQNQNLLVGWWSLASLLLFNWIALFSNMSAIKRLRAIARGEIGYVPPAVAPPAHVQPAATPPGWYPDPSGQAAQRYWDGATWTQWTNPPTHG